MNENKFTDNLLIKFQQLTWYLAILIFGLIVILYLVNSPLAPTFGMLGIILVLAATLLKLVIMAEKFKAIKKKNLIILSYFLILLLLSIVILRYFL